ncbi:hypothetical protein ACQ4PT_058321 [Festuca glaucescens]
MCASASSSTRRRSRRKLASPSQALPPVAAAACSSFSIPGVAMLPLVTCPCCRKRRTIRLVSRSVANPGRIFYKCPNHHIAPNPCNHYYWEDGEDSYGDFLARNGYLTGSGNVASAADAEFEEESEDEEEESRLKMMDDVGKKMGTVVKKLDEIIEISRNILVAILFLIAVMLYVAVVGK